MISNLSSHLFQDMDDNNYEAMKTAVMAVVVANPTPSAAVGDEDSCAPRSLKDRVGMR